MGLQYLETIGVAVMQKKLQTLFVQVTKFGLVGAVNTLLDLAIFTFLVQWWHYAIVKVISYGAGMVCSFVLNKRWTFRSRKKTDARQLVALIVVNLISLGVATGIMALLMEVIGMQNEKLANIITIPFSMGVNFLGTRLWVFGEK